MSKLNELQAGMADVDFDQDDELLSVGDTAVEAEPKGAPAVAPEAEPEAEPENDPEAEPEAEPEEEPKPADSKLKRFGLDGMFRSEEDALAAIPQQNRYIGRLEREMKEMKDQLRQLQATKPEPKKAPTVTDDEFIQSPVNALSRLNLASKDDVDGAKEAALARVTAIEERFAQQEALMVIESEPELKEVAAALRMKKVPADNRLWNAVEEFYEAHPFLESLSYPEALSICIPAARGIVGRAKAEPKPAADPKVAGAKTLGTKAAPSGTPRLQTSEDWAKLPDAKLEEHLFGSSPPRK